MGEILGNAGAQKSQGNQSQGSQGGGLNSILGILQNLKGINSKNQSNISGQQQNVAQAIYNPSNPLYQQLYGQQRQNIQQQGAAAIAQAGNQNRLLSSMGRTPLFSPERNGEEAFRQGVMNQQGADVEAQNQTRNILGGAEGALGQAMTGANQRSASQYGTPNPYTGGVMGGFQGGSNNQTSLGLGTIANMLQKGGF